jgi:hypothetical protein
MPCGPVADSEPVSDRTGNECMSGGGYQPADPHRCVECGTLDSLNTWGWRCYRPVKAPSEDDLPALPFYCSTCAELNRLAA